MHECMWIKQEREEAEERLQGDLCMAMADMQERMLEMITLWTGWKDVQRNLKNEREDEDREFLRKQRIWTCRWRCVKSVEMKTVAGSWVCILFGGFFDFDFIALCCVCCEFEHSVDIQEYYTRGVHVPNEGTRKPRRVRVDLERRF